MRNSLMAMAMSTPLLRLALLGRAAVYVMRLLTVFVVASMVLIVPAWSYRSISAYIHPVRTYPTQTPTDLGMTYTDAILQTRDGLHLAAWFVPGSRSDAVILIHGVGSNRDGMLAIAHDLWSRGYNVLLLELRAHGYSEGDTSTLGVREVEDVRAAATYLESRPGVDPQRIGVLGASLGSAVAIMGAAAVPEIHAVAADSVFASARWLVEHQLNTLVTLPDWFGPALLFVGGLVAGISPDDVSPIDAAARLGDRPLLVIQGEQDELFAADNARMVVAAASGPAQLWLEPHGVHTGIYALDPDLYADRLDTFFTDALEYSAVRADASYEVNRNV
jgi:uncharacterized protein